MKRRDFLETVVAAPAVATIVACGRDTPDPPAVVKPTSLARLRAFAIEREVEPALTFQPLRQRPR